MKTFDIILLVVGSMLSLLGGASGVALLLRALRTGSNIGDETNVGTLWGLFVVGLTFGLYLIWWALP
jgi:hypothetical protein